jgi:dual specificity phosphatase 12
VADVAARVLAAKEAHYCELTAGGIAAFPGAADIFRAALAAGMAVGVASSGAPAKIARNLESSGLAHLVPPAHVVSAAHVARGKPAPDVYLEAMRRMGAAACPERVLVVEDAVHGLSAARAAGAFAVAVTNSLPAARLAGHADLIVASLLEIDPAALAPPGAPPHGAPPPPPPRGE